MTLIYPNLTCNVKRIDTFKVTIKIKLSDDSFTKACLLQGTISLQPGVVFVGLFCVLTHLANFYYWLTLAYFTVLTYHVNSCYHKYVLSQDGPILSS